MYTDWETQDHIDPFNTEYPVAGVVGGKKILIFKIDSNLYRGVELRCPHQGALLNKAIILNKKRIRCHLHSYIFNLNDGTPVNCPGYRLKVYDVKLEGNKLMVRMSTDN